jgi:DNA-binding NarL/FixJ family response regulator
MPADVAGYDGRGSEADRGAVRQPARSTAEGRSNGAIAQRLVVSDKAVSKHCTSIFAKLDLPPSDDDNRRVLAVLAYLDS